MRRLLFLFALFWAGCTTDAVFVVDVDAPEGLLGREGDIRRLVVTVEHEGKQSVLLFPEEAPVPIPLPTDFSFSTPNDLRGVIEVEIEALDEQEQVIGVGASAATIAPGERTRFTIILEPPLF